MTKTLLPVFLAALACPHFAFAADDAAPGETSMKIEDAVQRKNKVEGDLDLEISNAKLRAESGSKSKYSLSVNAEFDGGGLNKPLAATRPDLYASSGHEKVSSLNGDINLRYRMNKNDSFIAGVGVGAVTPFQGDIDGTANQFKVNDPAIGFSRAVQKWGVENVVAGTVAFGTSKVSRSEDTLAYPTVSYTMMKNLANRLSLGIAAEGSYYSYANAPGQNAQYRINTGYGGDDRVEYSLGLYPILEYQISDKVSFRTVARYSSWFHLYGTPETASLLPETGTQSVGFGIVVTRDIFLYPNIQFMWQDMRADRTNVALNAAMNMF